MVETEGDSVLEGGVGAEDEAGVGGEGGGYEGGVADEPS